MELIISSELFSKSAKRLQKNNQNESLSLSQSKETLAKSLGFRNYDAIQKYFNKEGRAETIVKKEKLSSTPNFISSLSEEKLILLFTVGLSDDESSQRAKLLCNFVFPYLCYIREHDNIELTLSSIKNGIQLSEINNVSKRADIPEHISQNFKNYLYSLPGYAGDIQSMVSQDIHHNTVIKLLPVFLLFSKIEENRVVIIPDFIIAKLNRTSLEYRNPVYCFPELQKWQYFEDSSFFDDNIVAMIRSQSSKINGSLYLHDILLLSLNYINYAKRKKLFDIVNELADNLSVVKVVSQDLCQFKL